MMLADSRERAEVIATTGRSHPRPRAQRLWAQETLSDWWACYADKLEGGASQSVADEGDGLCHACSTFLGCFIFIALLGLLQEHCLSSLSETYQVQLPLLSAAWGAAAVQVFSSWQHDGAQPRSVLLGNLLGSCAGLVKILPVSLELQAALAVAATIATQELSGSVHPAGAANAVIFLEAQSCSWPSFACMCASATMLLVVVAALFNNTCMDRLYPQAWWPSPAVESEPGSSPKPPVGFIVDAPQQWLPTYLLKLRGAGNRGPVPVSYAHTCFSSLAAFAYMLSVASLNGLLGWTPASLVGPAAASVSVFSDWRGASSQPWPCVVGCVLGAASGSLFLLEASEGGSAFAGHLWMPAAMAVAFSAALQELAFAKIPAGGSIALSIIVMPEARRWGWSFVLQPGVLSTCLLVIYGALLNNLQETRLYPRHWPWQRATPGLPQQGYSERVLQRHRSEVEKTPFSALAKTNVGLLMVLSQIVFLIFLMFAKLDKTSVDVVEKFDHVAGLSLLTVVGLGFMRAFAKAHGLGAVAFCLVITSLAIQWSMVLESLLNQTVLSIGLDSLSSGYFAAATALVSFGALIGKVSLRQIFMVLLIELPCYCWTRSGGLSRDRVPHVHPDGLEGLQIHLFGALFGYSAACLLGPFEMDWLHQGSYGLDLVSLLGTLCFWICFPSIGYGSRTQHAHIIVVLALLGSTVAAFVADSLCDSGKMSVACIRTAVLAGGIAISAVAETVDPGLAVMVGSMAGTVSVLGLRFLSRSSVDTCGVLFAHGMPALLGWILYASPVLQHSAKAPENPALQLSRLCSCAVTAILSGCFCGYLLRRTRSESQDLATSDETIWVCAEDMPQGSATYRPIK
ncbi:RHAG [Symbiodinium microadriaticum]|nr:RHAG [Symbiodinium microadriaticum]